MSESITEFSKVLESYEKIVKELLIHATERPRCSCKIADLLEKLDLE